MPAPHPGPARPARGAGLVRRLVGAGLLVEFALSMIAPPLTVAADAPVAAARALLEAYHEDPTRIDRARELLEGEAQREPSPQVLIELARACFLTGELRATTDEARILVYASGREAGRRAVALAPRDERAHLYFAANDGRWVELKGILRSLFALPRLREAADTILTLNPSSPAGLTLAGSLAAEVPGFLGGDKVLAERHFQQALDIDPHHTGTRLELARLYIATGRRAEARRELERLLADRTPTDRPYWVTSEVPRARILLESLAGKP